VDIVGYFLDMIFVTMFGYIIGSTSDLFAPVVLIGIANPVSFGMLMMGSLIVTVMITLAFSVLWRARGFAGV